MVDSDPAGRIYELFAKISKNLDPSHSENSDETAQFASSNGRAEGVSNMTPLKTLLCSTALICASNLAGATLANAELTSNPARFQYVAKFVCGVNVPGFSDSTTSVLPGSYKTVVNVHNPQNQIVTFAEKIASAIFTQDVSVPAPAQLKPDQALSVDCNKIAKIFGTAVHPPIDGFVVVESPFSLDVTAVYTAGKNTNQGGEVASIAVEQVRERTLSP
jgi:hypothetical protein